MAIGNKLWEERIVHIRELRRDDYDPLIALWEAAGLPFRPRGRDRRDRIAREIAATSSIFLAAEGDGRLIGAVLGTHDGRKGWINRLAVHPDARGRGVGAALVAEVERRLDGLGIEIVTCLIETWNHDSMAFFERLGFLPHRDIVYYAKRRHPEV